MNIKLRITIVISFGLFQFFCVSCLFGENEPKKGDQSLQENVRGVEGKDSDGEGGIKEMADRLEDERKELEKLKILFNKKSQKKKQIISSVGEVEKVGKDDAKSLKSKNALRDQELPPPEHLEGGEVINKPDQGGEVVGDDRGRIIIKDKDSIVQPFGIAENLYKMEEYQLSLDIYKLIKGEEEEENRSWIKYQIANCYRKLKQYDKAVEMYHEVNKEFEGSYWGKQSQWYIQDIEWRKETAENVEVVVEK